MADQEEVTNLTPSQIVEGVKLAEPHLTITKLDLPYVYKGVSGERCVEWKRNVLLNAYLKSRHGF